MKTSADILSKKQAILDFISESDNPSLINKLKELIDSYRSTNNELPQWQKNELDNRLKAYYDNPDNVLDFDTVMDEIEASL